MRYHDKCTVRQLSFVIKEAVQLLEGIRPPIEEK